MADRSTLRADCARCAALCCVAPTFSRSTEFAFDKPAGVACRHLAEDLGCSIHSGLRAHGFAGCATYDCFGAGQRVVRDTYGGRDWRLAPQLAQQMFEVFAVMRGLHELMWYLLDATTLPAAAGLRGPLAAALASTEDLAAAGADALAAVDLDRHRESVVPLLRQVSALAREGLVGPDLAGADLVGRSLVGRDLRGASLRGARLVGADLRGADLHLADLTGADLRGADVRGTTLATALFMTQPQVDAARGDAGTDLPQTLLRPPHWA